MPLGELKEKMCAPCSNVKEEHETSKHKATTEHLHFQCCVISMAEPNANHNIAKTAFSIMNTGTYFLRAPSLQL